MIYTNEEKKIIKALAALERLWEKHGVGLVLFNGNSLRRAPGASSDEICSFPGIRGDGGDGGDGFGDDCHDEDRFGSDGDHLE